MGFKLGFASELRILNSIMGMYVRFRMVDAVSCSFDSMEERLVVTWTTMT